MVDLARKNLLHDKARLVLTLAGVSFSVCLVLVQVGLFMGMLDNASLIIDRTDADIWITSRNTPNVDFGQAFSDRYVDRVRSTPGVARADNLVVFYFDMALPTGKEERTIGYAMSDLAAWGLPWSLVEGSAKDLRSGPFIVLDRSARRRFGPFQVGDYREMSGKRVRIVGMTTGAMSFTTMPVMFLDHNLAQSLAPEVLEDKTMYIVAKLSPGADHAAVCQELRKRLPYNDVWSRDDWRTQTRMYWIVVVGLGLNMLLTVSLGCLVGVAVVAQTLYTSTIKQLPEFGTLKAIGASNFDIYRLLGRQSLLVALVGFVLGVGPALLLRVALQSMELKVLMPGWLLITVFFSTLALCLAAASVSFRKVASIDPAIVFRG
ncbi:MAG TPA: ABC transporter permease [Polyangiaceae bacterium]|nr:MAG: FtsX-like permease family protein [Deltaproteobacteria bacterium ADurb.Bin207]HNS98346.1 ABC transporter permease [Polyangiaceae bacterium]HNZ23677.1 ABC transporter permease [Polyangiaceae bacterium]HOD22407.1 ABC transporter permease [Polyangiaceae bacterium]HOE51526.1 ABC transporter permease [Polyangiaceae bacterium]